jgi:hypothetical protein
LVAVFGLKVMAASEVALDLSKVSVEELQYIHCVPALDKQTASVTHYVFDVREEDFSLYATSAQKSLKAKELVGLSQIESHVDQKVSAQDIDVQWRSAKNSLDFQLVIVDDGGQALEGTLINNGIRVPMKCVDAFIEN